LVWPIHNTAQSSTSTKFGGDIINKICKLFTAQDSGDPVQIKNNKWTWQDYFDMVPPTTAPAAPTDTGARRFYVDPADGHSKLKKTDNTTVDLEAALGPGNITRFVPDVFVFKDTVIGKTTVYNYRGAQIAQYTAGAAGDDLALRDAVAATPIGGVMQITRSSDGSAYIIGLTNTELSLHNDITIIGYGATIQAGTTHTSGYVFAGYDQATINIFGLTINSNNLYGTTIGAHPSTDPTTIPRYVNIRDCVILRSWNYGIKIGGNSVFNQSNAITNTTLVLENCIISTGDADGTNITYNGLNECVDTDSIETTIIKNCRMYNWKVLYLTGKNIILEGNTFDTSNCAQSGQPVGQQAPLQAENTVAIGNEFIDVAPTLRFSAQPDASVRYNAGKRIYCSHNTIKRVNATSTWHAIEVVSFDDLTYFNSEVLIEGNWIDTAPIYCFPHNISARVSPATFYNDATKNQLVKLSSVDMQRTGEIAVDGSSILTTNTPLGQVSVWLTRVGNPTGTLQCVCRKGSDDSIGVTIGTIDVSTIATTQTLYTFTLSIQASVIAPAGGIYKIVATDKLLLEYTGGGTTDYIQVAFDSGGGVDTTHSVRVDYNGSYANTTGSDLSGSMYQLLTDHALIKHLTVRNNYFNALNSSASPNDAWVSLENMDVDLLSITNNYSPDTPVSAASPLYITLDTDKTNTSDHVTVKYCDIDKNYPVSTTNILKVNGSSANSTATVTFSQPLRGNIQGVITSGTAPALTTNFIKNRGTVTKSGDGTTLIFSWAHGLSAAPTKVIISPKTLAAADQRFVTADGTNITVTFSLAPPNVASNLVWYWEAEY